jgi:hypothetical protein
LVLVRFDDRLLTVLNQPTDDRHDAAVRWRQLVDLVARAGSSSETPAVAEAIGSIRAEAPHVDESLRAAAARAVAALPLPLGLLEYFASDSLPVSAPVLAAATLDTGQWRALTEHADEETRRFIETLHPEMVGSPPVELTDMLVQTEAQAAETPPPPEPPVGPSLHDVVERIERRRRTRAAQEHGVRPTAPGAKPGSPAMFRWECGPSGEITWIEGAPRGALIGRSIARPHDIEGDWADPEVARAFAVRAPFRDATVTFAGDGLLAGGWKISGVPAFEPADGRFAGYRGVALRDQAPQQREGGQAADMLSDPDSLRELVHEIKTPLNAIMGFAEIIDGQFLGPADRRYRERASGIVAHAKLLLTGINDLDFAAKVHSASLSGGRARVDLGELLEGMIASLREIAATRQVELDAARSVRNLTAAMQLELAERLIFRLVTAMLERAEPGERLRITADQTNQHCRVSISTPAALQGLSHDQLFVAGDGGPREVFGLRLARGLARIAGGDLIGGRDAIALLLPRA